MLPRSLMAAPKILVVDDQPINVQLLKSKLEREGLEVIAASTGIEAINLVNEEWPDLILLEMIMPDMDGIELCQRLQSREETRSIPVIFITARPTKEIKLEGLRVGAVDYITKPIDLDEVLARVQTQLRFVALNRQILDLQRRLEESRRAATIGAITQSITHNFNNLLGVVIGYLDLIKVFHDKPDNVKSNAVHVEDAVQRIVGIIQQLSSLGVKIRPPLITTRLDRLIEGAVSRFHNDYKLTALVTVTNPSGRLEIDANTEVFDEIVSRVLINAWESYDQQPVDQRPIYLTTQIVEKPGEPKFIEIRIEDRGRGIDPGIRDRMFEPFISSKQTGGVGVGLTITRQALRTLGGEVTMEDRPGGGTIAILLHPVSKRVKRS
jgi:two-component system, sensor histidine kinase and response regulator